MLLPLLINLNMFGPVVPPFVPTIPSDSATQIYRHKVFERDVRKQEVHALILREEEEIVKIIAALYFQC